MLYEAKENFSLNWKGELLNFYENEIIDPNLYDSALIEHLKKNYNINKATSKSIKSVITSMTEELEQLEEVDLVNIQKKIIQLKSEIAILKSYL